MSNYLFKTSFCAYVIIWWYPSPGTGFAERRKHRSHKFLCLRVGKPMKKTFVSNASASMQQYAQQGKKHEYWFAVPQERSVLLHLLQHLLRMHLNISTSFSVILRIRQKHSTNETYTAASVVGWLVH